jgi:hypothetical protein
MLQIQLTNEIAQQIMLTPGPIEIVNDQGARVGFFTQPVSESELIEAKKRLESNPTGSALDDVWTRVKASSKSSK